jgi:hypothetical protein
MSPTTYEVHLRGHLPPDLLAELEGATFSEADSETVLLTLDLDQEGLHRLVGQLRDLGIELLELRHVSITSSDLRPPDKP